MNRADDPYSLFPREKFAVRMKHFHPGNSDRETREKADYFSVLTVRNLAAESEFSVTAKCHKADNPSREKAREVLRMKAQAVAQERGWL